MEAITFAPERFFPDLGKAVYKVHADLGGHFIGSRVMPKKKGKARTHTGDTLEVAAARDEVRQVMVKGFRQRRAAKAVRAKMLEELEGSITQEQKQEMAAIVDEAIRKEYGSLYLRRRRFLRKAMMYNWTHFCTFTYDSSKIASEEEFRTKLNNKLMNLANRHGWKCAGVWERGEQGERLHFHALMYIPEGQMVGKIVEVEQWSTKRGIKEKRLQNDHFWEIFGKNDFAPLNPKRLKAAVEYCSKYMQKSGERIRYSRGIPSEILLDLQHDDMYLDYFAADSIMSLLVDGRISWERDIAVFNTLVERKMRRLVNLRDGCSIPPPMASREAT